MPNTSAISKIWAQLFHAHRHKAGAPDEIDLSGLTPGLHATRHENAGPDEISVGGLSGTLADEQPSTWSAVSGKPSTYPPTPHASAHEDGGADEIDVTNLSGLLYDEQNAGQLKGVIIDDSAIGDGKVLTYVASSGHVEYI